jgi:hypothetical protein
VPATLSVAEREGRIYYDKKRRKKNGKTATEFVKR